MDEELSYEEFMNDCGERNFIKLATSIISDLRLYRGEKIHSVNNTISNLNLFIKRAKKENLEDKTYNEFLEAVPLKGLPMDLYNLHKAGTYKL